MRSAIVVRKWQIPLLHSRDLTQISRHNNIQDKYNTRRTSHKDSVNPALLDRPVRATNQFPGRGGGGAGVYSRTNCLFQPRSGFTENVKLYYTCLFRKVREMYYYFMQSLPEIIYFKRYFTPPPPPWDCMVAPICLLQACRAAVPCQKPVTAYFLSEQ